MSHLDAKHKDPTCLGSSTGGIITLITARHRPLVRTAYPYIGANEIPQGRFLVVNLISPIMWTSAPWSGLLLYLSSHQAGWQYESQFLSVISYLPVAAWWAAPSLWSGAGGSRQARRLQSETNHAYRPQAQCCSL